MANKFLNNFDTKNLITIDNSIKFKEKKILKLSSNKVFKNLNWSNKMNLEECIRLTALWYKDVLTGKSPLKTTQNNINYYTNILNTKEKKYAS